MRERTKTAPNWEILTVGAAMLAAVSTMALYLGGRIDAQGLEMGGRIDAQGAELSRRIDEQGAELSRRIDEQGAELGRRIDGLAAAQRETGERLARLEALAFGPSGLGGGPPAGTRQP